MRRRANSQRVVGAAGDDWQTRMGTHGGKPADEDRSARARAEWVYQQAAQMAAETRRGVCRVCHRVMPVYADGALRHHSGLFGERNREDKPRKPRGREGKTPCEVCGSHYERLEFVSGGRAGQVSCSACGTFKWWADPQAARQARERADTSEGDNEDEDD